MPTNEKASIVTIAAKLVGGSAIAGFGFAFGRDVYKKTKANLQNIVVFILAACVLLGAYLSGLWLFRNYKTLKERILYSIYSIIVFIPALVALAVIFPRSPEIENDLFVTLLSISMGLFLIGTIVALLQRRKRSFLWALEDDNERFLQEHNLVNIDANRIRDTHINQDYRIEDINKGGIALFALGRRNKRAYIEMDEYGRFRNYTGLLSI